MGYSSHLAFLSFLLFFHSLLHSSTSQNPKSRTSSHCSSFACGELGHIRFPFNNQTNPECGLFDVDRCTQPFQRIRFAENGSWYNVTRISQDNTVVLSYQVYVDNLGESICNESFRNRTNLPSSPSFSFNTSSNLTLFHCSPSQTSKNLTTTLNGLFCYDDLQSPPQACSIMNLSEMKKMEKSDNGSFSLTGVLSVEVHVHEKCYECYQRRGECQHDSKGKFLCSKAAPGHGRPHLKLGIGIGVGLTGVVLSIFMVWHWRRRKINASQDHQSRPNSSYSSSKSDMENGNVYFGVPIFSYKELEKATSNFSDEKELGDGGFGTVYYGKLRDGREVAVKRLYEHNYKRVEQFMNEIKILTRLRHKNLVSLYGCTSRHSQGLLLVYEFVANGTVADHLHGDKSNPKNPLPWASRMKIAIETAAALAYLHASDIIHRDVKTNNILLDNNFSVKVADFGLSRLLPTDVTHVSTAPQGSPGYVDPEYHQCFQLTDKSDVYSFGVVLIELISSMPAVDISRHKDEIVLANLAINKIQRSEIDGLIDPSLEFRSDKRMKRMIVSVAELAFQCLQQNKDVRPSMEEVQAELIRIDKIGEECKLDSDDNEVVKSTMLPPPSPPLDCSDEVALLKNRWFSPSSPVSVTEKWISSSNPTPNISC